MNAFRCLTGGTGVLALLGLLASSAVSLGQEGVVARQVKGAPGKDIRIGLYINLKPDCTSGPLPTIRLVDKPEHGSIKVKKVKVNATNYKQCLALEVPGYVAVYRSAPDFVGADAVTLEVKYPGGRTELQKITVTVAGSSIGL